MSKTLAARIAAVLTLAAVVAPAVSAAAQEQPVAQVVVAQTASAPIAEFTLGWQ